MLTLWVTLDKYPRRPAQKQSGCAGGLSEKKRYFIRGEPLNSYRSRVLIRSLYGKYLLRRSTSFL